MLLSVAYHHVLAKFSQLLSIFNGSQNKNCYIDMKYSFMFMHLM